MLNQSITEMTLQDLESLINSFVEEMAKNRRELDGEMAVYESSLEENQKA
ncbi:MAG: hypothetical protein ACKOQS_22560 [Dolichospermum sp.]